jgi:hypothetical protein
VIDKTKSFWLDSTEFRISLHEENGIPENISSTEFEQNPEYESMIVMNNRQRVMPSWLDQFLKSTKPKEFQP